MYKSRERNYIALTQMPFSIIIVLSFEIFTGR